MTEIPILLKPVHAVDGVLKKFRSSRSQMFFKIFTRKHLCWSLFNKVACVACNFIKKRLEHRCFLVNIAKILKTAFFIEHLQWLILKIRPGFLAFEIVYHNVEKDGLYNVNVLKNI